jgi:hypothetical protein
VCNAVSVFKQFLCPGLWCDRYHCKNHSGISAYNCAITRPSVCGEYEKYIEKKVKKQYPYFKEGDDALQEMSKFTLNERFQCAGMYFYESIKKFIVYERMEIDGSIYYGTRKTKIEALLFLLTQEREFDYRTIEYIRELIKNNNQ